MARGKRRSLAEPMPGEFERILMGQFPSKSKPGTFHEVRLGHDNVLYCTCPSWRFLRNGVVARTCPHVRNVQAALNRLRPGAAAPGQKGVVGVADANVENVRAFLPFEEWDDDDEK